MTANTANRQTVRDELARLLGVALVGTGLPVEEVAAYPKGLIEKSPVVYLASNGSSRMRAGIGDARWNNFFVFEIYTFIRDADAASGWSEQMVEDKLDLIDKMIADVVADNRSNQYWTNISFSLDSGGMPAQSEIMTDTERGYMLELKKIYIQKMDSQ